jgi:dCTP deaminase
MVLSDRDIVAAIESGRIGIDPWEPRLLQPCSVDVRLDSVFRVFNNWTAPFIDVADRQDDLTELVDIPADGSRPFMLHPGEFVLGSTLEVITIGQDVVGRLEGKSSLGRLGLVIHSTAGWADAGFTGHITLELSNLATLPITLYPGMPVGQLAFMSLTSPVEHPYTGKYRGQRGPTASRYYENFGPDGIVPLPPRR